MKQNKMWQALFIIMVTSIFSQCASEIDKSIEETRFLLDKGRYTEAVDKIGPVATANPNNFEAQYFLAVARIGKAALGDGVSYVGKLSDLLRDKAPDESEFATFARIAPSPTYLSDLYEARDSLIALTAKESQMNATFVRSVYFQLYLARLFEIAAMVTIIGADSDNLLCNADHAFALKDNIPDDFDPDAATPEETDRFNDNLVNIDGDGIKAGIAGRFDLTDRLISIETALNVATTAADFFKEAFGDTGAGVLLCTEDK